uniref:W2 domain-containing protein n=1 Tax=Strigamia maritima TaxID=126957 RepID=T1J0U7_STRMM
MSLQKGKPNSQQILQAVPPRGPQQMQIPPRGTPPNVGDEYIQRMYPNQQMRSAVHQQQMSANTNPHDMGKQGQPGMPGASNTQMVFGAHIAPPFYSRQPPPRAQVSNVNQRPGINMGMNPAAATQQQPSFYAHSQQPPPQQPQQMIPLQQINTMQHMYMTGGGAPNYRMPYPPQQSYQVPTQTQTMYVSTANTPFAYHGGNPPVFYSHMLPRHQVQSMPQAQQSQLPKREKKLIRIQDPTTSRDVTEEIVGHKIENADSRTSEVAAQFATQVAGVIGQQAVVKEQLPQHQQHQQQPAQVQMQQHIAAISTRSAVTVEKSTDSNEPKTEIINPNVTSAQVKLAEKSSAETEIRETQSANVVTRNVTAPFNLPTFTNPIEVNATTATEHPVDTPVVVARDFPQLPVEVEVVLPEHIEQTPVIVQQETIVSAAESADVSADDEMSPQENGDVGANEMVDPHAEKWETESKEMKKQKSKKHKVYLNRKGESKQGGDMDAFVDKDEIALPVGSPSVPEEVSIVDDINSKEEERKVAEKNEENTKVSQDFERNEQVIDVIDQPITKIQTIPKYNYKEDQWSPLNPEGKRQYDRSFLLRMQSQPMSLRKPEGLPDLEVIKDSVTVWSNKQKPFERPASLAGFQRPHIPDFIPGYVKSSGTPRNAQVNRRPSQQGGKTEQKKKIVLLSFNPDVRLNKSENAWRPTHKFGKDTDTETLKTEDLYKRVRGILNKLTPQKFNTLVNQVNDLSIDTEERLKGVIDLVFEKALDEPNFSVAYANLCKCLAMKKVPIGNKDNDFVNFRKLLLNKCQKEFERDTADDVARIKRAKEMFPDDEAKKRELDEELEDLERKAKRRSLGNIRFIGELFKLHMLTASIMHDCLKKLLNQEDEDSLECLCRLLTTIGKDIDPEKSKSNNKEPVDDKMNSYFRMMKEIINKRQASPRVRFMLQDVTDLRQNNWVPRRDENNPKTLDQIHLEAEREANEREMSLTQPQSHRRMEDKRKRGMGGGSSLGEDGWNTVGSKNSGRIDPQKLKLSKVNVDEDIQLGPGGRNVVGWSRGSSGGSRTSSQEPESKSSAPANRFQALANEPCARVEDSRRGINRNAPSSSRDSSKGRGTQMAPPAQRSGKAVVQSQKEKEREQAIAAVKTIAGGESGRAPVDSSRESSITREEKKDVALRGNPDLTEMEIEKRAKALLDEFLHNTDFQEAILCVSEICAPTTISFFVTYAFNCVLERSAQTRQQIGQLMHDLIKAKVMTVEQYIKGLQAILSLVEDYAIDIPHIWEYLGELIAPLIKDCTLPLSFLHEAAQPCYETGCGGFFVAAVLHAVSKKLGTHEVGELWRSSNLQWSQFLPTSKKTEEFIKENKLEFTVKPREPCKSTNLSSEQLKTELASLFASKQSENEEIFDWIDAHLNESQCHEASFVRVLMIAVCQSVLEKSDDTTITVDEALLRNRCNILRKYLDHSEACEMQALYALQALMHQLEQPKGVLYSFFGFLYDEEIISEDAFLLWEMSEDPVEQEGKGVALNSVRSFYVWLKEAENESIMGNYII